MAMCKGVPAGALPDGSEAGQQVLLVQIAVSQVTGVALAALVQPDRGGVREAFARQMAMYLCRLVYTMSLRDIALAFGRDRSTAMHAIRRVEDAREDPEIDRRLAWLETVIQRMEAFDD
jgi:chromosomal replication initiation ATPase DnaA